LTTRLPSAN